MIVRIALPAVISAREGVYIAVRRFSLLNVPPEMEDHVILDVLPPIIPSMIYVSFSQMVVSEPALTVGTGFIVIVILSVMLVHGPSGLSVVIVRLTLPAVMSAPEGVYVAVSRFASSKVPDVGDVHVILEAPPPIIPDNV